MRRSRQIDMLLLLALLTALAAARPAGAQAPTSRVWIDGTSSVNAFTCASDDVQGPGLLTGTRASGEARIRVPVSTLDCGNGRMNKDLREALRSREHPLIRFDVERTEVLDRPSDGTDPFRVRTTGRLEIAGMVRSVAITLEGRRLPDGRIRTTGSTPLSLSDYRIDPPTALYGLIKVHDRVVVHFDLVEPAAAGLAVGDVPSDGDPGG